MSETATPTERELKHIPLSEIRENPVALRAVSRESAEVAQLFDSIRKNGVNNPINVRYKDTDKSGRKDGRLYEIVDGLHRYTGSLEAGLKTIPAQVLNISEEQSLISQIESNLQKINTKPQEYTRALVRILAGNPGMTEAELATQLSVSPAFINQRLSLTKLIDSVGTLVNEGKIMLNNAFALAKLPPDEQPQWVERAMTEGSAEFGPAATLRAKQLKEARQAAVKAAGPQEFQPIPVQRKLAEIKEAYGSDNWAKVLVQSNDIKSPVEAAKMAIAWVLNMDPESQKAARQRDAERKQKAADDKARRDAERAGLATAAQNQVITEAQSAPAAAVA